MKKLLLVVGLLMFMASSSMAMLSMGVAGAYYSYSGSSVTGYGAEVGLGLIPFVDSRLVAIYIPIDGTQAIIPATLNLKFGIPSTPLYLDAGTGYLFYSNSGSGVTAVTGAFTYNAAVGYEQDIMPMMKWFVQGGYEGMTVKYTLLGTEVTSNFSGVGAKAGLRFNI